MNAKLEIVAIEQPEIIEAFKVKQERNWYTVYFLIDVHGTIKATQINHITNSTNEILIRSYFQPDDHNNPTFLVLPDG